MEIQISDTTLQTYTRINTESGMIWMTQRALKQIVIPTQRVLTYYFMKKSNDFYFTWTSQFIITNKISSWRIIFMWFLFPNPFHVFLEDVPEVSILFFDDFIEDTHFLCELSHHFSRKFAILNKIYAKIVIFWSLLQKLFSSL